MLGLWTAYYYLFVPSGALLSALLLTGVRWCQSLAMAVMGLSVRVGKFELNLVSCVTSFCLLVFALAYYSMAYEQDRAKSFTGRSYEESQRNLFRKERDVYLSLLGVSLWVIPWRLVSLRRGGMLLSGSELKRERPSFIKKMIYIVIAVLFVVSADLPLCRLNYNYYVTSSITPKKEALLRDASETCAGIRLASAEGSCLQVCQDAKKLSEDRLKAIMWARDWHILGKYAAEVFDNFRGVEQGADRIEKLFVERSCVDVLKSVDKTNHQVNYGCWAAAGVSLTGALVFISRAMDTDPAKDASKKTN